jgi:hypothetical protein
MTSNKDDDLIRRGEALAIVGPMQWSNSPIAANAASGAHKAIAALPAVTPGVKVKPLVWHPDHGCDAWGMGILYSMHETSPGLFAMVSPFHSDEDLPKSEMQATAQADYAARILAAIDAQPAPDVAALVEALRPLARMADRYDPREGDDDLECWSGLATPKIKHLRKARATLAKIGGGE